MPQNENPAAMKDMAAIRRKGLTYFLLTFVLIVASVLSFLMVRNLFGKDGGEGNILQSLSFLTFPVVLGMAALLLVYFALDGLRLLFVLRTLGFRVSFFYIVRLSFVNMFVSAITPFATGGGFAQLYFLTKRGVPLGSATAATTIRTLLAILFFFIAAPAVLIWNPGLLEVLGGYVWILVVTVAVYCLIVIFLFWMAANEKRAKRAVYRFTRFLSKKRVLKPKRARKICLGAFSEVRNFNKGVSLFLKGRRLFLILSLLFTVLFLFALFSVPAYLLWAMEYDVSPVLTYQAMTLITFVMYFAFTPGAAGIAEGGFALIFSGFIGRGDITSLTLLWRFFSVFVGTVIGLIVFYVEVFSKPKKDGPDRALK
ncbi:MAG: flippase-like domain-containing protein [Oscillospiraceae bacterium]|jgi:uncharacterized protein (TIRG00374 family)|nr:flippase-like domain-containing protein [Oscillospiraceae bacterium]